MDCVFCRIVQGQEKAAIIYEDDEATAFLDLAPVTRGQCLLVPRQHYPSIAAVPPDLEGRLIVLATRLAVAVSKAVDADGFNILLSNGTCAGQAVRHACLTIVPRFPLDGVALPPVGGRCPDAESMQQVINKIRKRWNRHEA